jgi:hypothetical protein
VTVLQLTTDDPLDVLVPGTAYSFGVLKQAQATGDSEALLARGRPVVRVDLGRNVERGFEQLLAALARRPAKARPARTPRARSTPKPARPRATRR